MSQNDPAGLAHAKKLIRENLESQATFLHLGNCGLYDLSELPELWNCQHLEGLNLGSFNNYPKNYYSLNKLGNDDAQLIGTNLNQLTWLDLSSNKIEVEGVKAIAENLKFLTHLSLTNNNIGDDGIEVIVKNIDGLLTLYVWNCQITDKGVELIGTNLTQLTKLNLRYNKIKNIKPLLTLLQNDKVIIEINDNPIINPPLGILAQGREAIVRFFSNLEKEKFVKLETFINREVKLILVGNSYAGKSTLVQYLSNKRVLKDLTSTHWMEISNWKNPFLDNTNIDNIRIFDFGGQEYYHDTHHLFFTNNTAYLLLWYADGNGFKEIEVEQKSAFDQNIKKVNIQCFPLEYWMGAISHFSTKGYKNQIPENKSIQMESTIENFKKLDFDYDDRGNINNKYLKIPPPVLIIENKVDTGKPCKLPLEKYVSTFNKIDIYESISVSLYEERNLENLKYSLKNMISNMNIIGGEFQGTYGIIRENLLDFKREISLTFEEFLKLCNDWIVAEGKKQNKDFTSLQFSKFDAFDCANVFNWLGYILFFPASPKLKNRVFLNQKIITESIYKILFKAENTKGEINKIDALFDSNLVENELDNMLALMQEFKIIFKHPDPNKKDIYIAPLYLPSQPTKAISFFISSLQKLTYRIEYDGFIHKSIILEFFQEYGQHVLKERKQHYEDIFYYWRNGIVVKKVAQNGKGGLVLVQFFVGQDTVDNNDDKVSVAAHIDIFSLKEGSENLIKEIREKLTEINNGWKVTEKVTIDGHIFIPLAIIHKNEINKQNVFQYADQQFQLIHFKQYLNNTYPMKKVFISYSKSDEHYRNELEKHLSVLKRNGHIATWHDRKLLPGEKWDGKIRQELKEADIILFLVSADFLATDYIWDVEIKEALERDKNNEQVHVVPIIVRPCDWADSPLGVYNSGTVKGKAINLANNTDAAYLDVVELLKGIIKK